MKSSLEGKKQSWDSMFYSVQRMDLLIISISGAGIYVCLEAIKYMATNKDLCSDTCFIKISAGLFLVGIITNFFSQHYGYLANYNSYLMYECEVDVDDINSLDEISADQQVRLTNLDCESREFEKKSEKLSNLTTNLNYFSMAFMFLGLIVIFLYFVITF